MELKEKLKHKIDFKTKPVGSLGLLEEIALQVGMVQQTETPKLTNPTIIVFAADHGLADEGVSPFPKAVTYQMVMNFLNGGAAISVFCRQNGIKLKIADAGVDADFMPHPDFIDAKIAKGTRNSLREPAMTLDECWRAIEKGAGIVVGEYVGGCNIIGFGEMGIGNTSSASLLMSKFCNLPVEKCTGRGTGHVGAGLKKKTEILQKVASKYTDLTTPIEILATFGGFEIAMMAGAMMKAAELGMVIMVDGFIATSALLSAYKMKDDILKNCIFCHKSNEQAHRLMLEYFGARAILDIDLRLGEATGVAVAYPVIQSAVAFLNEMASFESAGVSNKD
jgi:nicotinate-nucleotide--dimethylbenzimidazole phosphoribosyltransferase